LDQPAPVVLIVNSNEDTIEMLRLTFDQKGWNSAQAHIADIKRGRSDLAAVVRRHQPSVIVYDIAPPYEENWLFLQTLRTMDVLRDIPFVVTSTNKAAVAKAGGPENVIEIIGKPYDLEEVAAAAERARRSGAGVN
jgi:CheY-like chemotaxis protein